MQFQQTTVENLLQELSEIQPQAVIALNFDDEQTSTTHLNLLNKVVLKNQTIILKGTEDLENTDDVFTVDKLQRYFKELHPKTIIEIQLTIDSKIYASQFIEIDSEGQDFDEPEITFFNKQ